MVLYLIKLKGGEHAFLRTEGHMTNSMFREIEYKVLGVKEDVAFDYLMETFNEIIVKDALIGIERAKANKLETLINDSPSWKRWSDLKSELDEVGKRIQETEREIYSAKRRRNKEEIVALSELMDDLEKIMAELKSEKTILPPKIVEYRIKKGNHIRTAKNMTNEIETYFTSQRKGESDNFYAFKTSLNNLVDGGFGIVALRDIKYNGQYSEYFKEAVDLCFTYGMIKKGDITFEQLDEIASSLSFDCTVGEFSKTLRF